MSTIEEKLIAEFSRLTALSLYSDKDWSGWTFEFVDTLPKHIEGEAHRKSKRILLSKRGDSLAEYKETLLHEITHAYMGGVHHRQNFCKSYLRGALQAGYITVEQYFEFNNKPYSEIEKLVTRAIQSMG